jgi:hypothetical protein
MEKKQGVSFSRALNYIKKGGRARRPVRGISGSPIFIHANAICQEDEQGIPYCWFPSGEDLLAEDWELI